MDYRELMNGAGLGDVLIPKKEFVKEHERLVALLNQSDIPALRKEAKEQKAELEAELAKKGGSKGSNFVARMMAEAKYKHRSPSDKDKPYSSNLGKYVRGSVMDPDEDDTKMSEAVKFDYNRLANANQSSASKNKKGNPYGASPFISMHFGNAQSKPRESAIQKAARNRFRTKRVNVSRAVEEPEQKDSFDKRVASREAYKQRKSERQSTLEDVRLPESKKRKERRDRQAEAKRREDEIKMSAMSDRTNERNAEQEKKARAKKNVESKKAQYEKSIASEPKGFLSASDTEPRSRPPNMSKSDWLRYLDSRQYRDLIAQRAFEAQQEAQRRAFRFGD